MNFILDTLPEYLAAHIKLTMAAMVLALLIAVPFGILATRRRALENIILGIAGVIQTIPGLAMLAVMVPLFSWLGFRGIGFFPALVGLTLYGLFPIVMGVVTGFKSIDQAVLQAAKGVGMTPKQQLFRVELPLAAPVIISGIRTATVWCVGMATLSTPVGATSLGNYIFSGLQTRNFTAVVVGCVAAAALAQVLDRTVQLLQNAMREHSRWRLAAGVSTLVLLAGWSVAGDMPAFARDQASRPRVRVGAKTFSEQYILAEYLSEYLKTCCKADPKVLNSLGSSVVFEALAQGDIDLYVDYSGTLWTNVLHRERVASRVQVREQVSQVLKRDHNVHVLADLGFENTYVFTVTPQVKKSLSDDTLSALATESRTLRLATDYEFLRRPEWKSLKRAYDLEFAEHRVMDPAIMYQAFESGQVDVFVAYSTDGRLSSTGGVTLRDDREVIPPYDALILASENFVRAYPRMTRNLQSLRGHIDNRRMRDLNHAVDTQTQSPNQAARTLLRRNPRPKTALPGDSRPHPR